MNDVYVKNYELLQSEQLKQDLHEEPKQILCIDTEDGVRMATGTQFSTVSSKHAGKVKSAYTIIQPMNLGDQSFKETYGTQYAYYAGAMANGISSVEMIIELGKMGFMGSLGTGGVGLNIVEKWIDEIQSKLKGRAYLVNFLSSPSMPVRELEMVELLLRKKVHAIEASAFVAMSKAIVYYRVSGLYRDDNGNIKAKNHIIAKVSREEVAIKFMSAAPLEIVKVLYAEHRITKEQAELSQQIAMADDITVEADSGGHTDNRPFVSLFPAILSLNSERKKINGFQQNIRIGGAGGISTPIAALSAFQMGAAYIVTGSVNQGCVEAGTSEHVKVLLTKVRMQDVVMAPSADMFESGSKVQVIKQGTMYPMNAQKLYQIYTKYKSIEEISEQERKAIEKRLFHYSLEEIWKKTKEYFNTVDKTQISMAEKNPKYKMALIFKWYLGQSSRWAINDDRDRKMDMQIWCGQSMGAFNQYVHGTKYEQYQYRRVADIAAMIMDGAAYLTNIQYAALQGADVQSIKEYTI